MSVFSCSAILLSQEYHFLRVKASINPERLSRGQEGQLILHFTNEKGVTINPQPAFIIELGSSGELAFPKDFFTSSDLKMTLSEEDGYEFLDLTKSVAIPFVVKLEATRGSHSLMGKIKYFARSKKDGWCLKNTIEFSASFYTSNRVFKKKE